MANAKSTYIRKLADGEYEFGLILMVKNYRKQNPQQPSGTAKTLSEAEAARSHLADAMGLSS